MKLNGYLVLLIISSILAGCASTRTRAPVYEKAEAQRKAAAESGSPQREKDWRPRKYVVQKGDTLYSIAFNYGFDYHELADMNGISDPKVISIGQEIRLFPSKASSAKVVTTPVEIEIKEQPKLVKYPYSDAAVAQIEKVQKTAVPPSSIPSSVAPVDKEETNAEAESETEAIDAPDEAKEGTPDWAVPTKGKLIAGFSESARRKGVDIAGKLGQPIFASASGKVVYSGSGLRGYGKLIIIKHNQIYLSAYAHNDKILVKEGQNVTRGQKIAVMGKTDSKNVKLHFEVRRLGKPIDPAKFIKFGKS